MLNRTEEVIHPSDERTLKDISVNAAALLCYVVGWISGIVFLVLEQKNRFIRFHALQSIIVFGTLTLAGIVLDRIPFVGGTLAAIMWAAGFVLWIILMVKAGMGETFKLPWAGNLAEKLAMQSMPSPGTAASGAEFAEPAKQATPDQSAPFASASQNSPAVALESQARNETRRQAFRSEYYSPNRRTLRIVGSSFAIAFSLALLIFFNFFHQYIGYYQPQYVGGHTYWQISSFLTSDFSLWLPVINTALIMGIIGHAVIIAFDKYLVRQGVELVLDFLGLAAVISLLAIFPFDFSVIPNVDVAESVPIIVTVALAFTIVGFVIGILVRGIRLIVHAVDGRY